MVASDPQCSRDMHGVHPGPLGEVARRLPVRGYLLHRTLAKKFSLRCAGFRLAGKPLDPLNDTHTAPRHYRMEVRAEFSAASGKLASWFAAVEACHRAMQGIAGCSAKLGHEYRNIFCTLSNSCSSHLDGPREPSGATWRPRGRPRRPPECPDGHGRLRRHFPGREMG